MKGNHGAMRRTAQGLHLVAEPPANAAAMRGRSPGKWYPVEQRPTVSKRLHRPPYSWGESPPGP